MDDKEKKSKLRFYTTLQIVGLLVIMIVGNAFDWLNMKFDFTKLSTWKYWNAVFQQIVMYATALIIGYLGRLEKEILNNIEYHTNLKHYRELLPFKKDASFTQFINYIKNPQIKKEFIKKRMQIKLYRLDKYTKDEYKLEYDKALASGNLETYNYKDKKSKKYCLKRFKLEQLYSDDYIDKNYLSISINYPRVNAQAFTYGIRVKEQKSHEYQVENEAAKDLSKKWILKALQVLLSALIVGSVASDASTSELLEQTYGWLKLMLQYIVRCVIVVVSYITGMKDGKETFEINYIDVIYNRITILNEYIKYIKENKIEDDIVDKLNKYMNLKAQKEAEEENKKKKELEEDQKKQNNKENKENDNKLLEELYDKDGNLLLTEKELKNIIDNRKNK